MIKRGDVNDTTCSLLSRITNALGSILILWIVVASAYAQKAIRYEGRTVSCWQGRTVPGNGLDVLLYSSEEHSDVIKQVKRVSDLGKHMQDSQSQDAIDAFNAAYGKLEQMVARTMASVPHTKSGPAGIFRLEVPEPGSKQWLVLAINLKVEDDLSAYGYQIGTDYPLAKLEIFVGDRSCRATQ